MFRSTPLLSAALCLLLLLAACDEPKIVFSEAFPKKAIDMTRVWGDQLRVQEGDKITSLDIEFHEKTRKTLITHANTEQQTIDTLFYGLIARSRGIHYFSTEWESGKWTIQAVDIGEDSISSFWEPTANLSYLEANLSNNDLHNLIVANDTAKGGNIVLATDKKVLHRYFKKAAKAAPYALKILDESDNISPAEEAPDTPVTPDLVTETLAVKLFPNPATDYSTIQFREPGTYNIELTDASGRQLFSNQVTGSNTTLDLKAYANGIYLLQVKSEDSETTETVEMMVQR